MTVLSLRRPALPVALVAAALSAALSAALVTAVPATAQTTPPADRAAAWLAGELSPAGTVIGSFDGEEFTDYGQTLDSAIALLAAGTRPGALGRALGAVEQPDAVAQYTQGAPFDADDAAYVGATAKLAFVVELSGGDATSVGGVDLLAQLQSLATPQGRFADRSDFGNFANLFGHAFALLAQDTAGRPVPPRQISGLTSAQCDDGGFPVTYEPAEGKECTGSVDATGLVLQALAAIDLGRSMAARSAVAWLEGQQQGDGLFPGEVPVNSTGYAASGLLAVDAENRAAARATARLAQLQRGDGALPGTPGGDADLFATAQALPALAGQDFRDGARPVVRRPVLFSIDPLCERAPAGAFSDTEGNVHAGAIGCLAALRVTEGRDGDRYAPSEQVSRGQMASFLARALRAAGVDVRTDAPSRFTDVPAGSVHSEAINGLAALGVVNGTTDTTFSPRAAVSRGQMAALLARGYDEAADVALPVVPAPFTDAGGTHARDIGRIADVGITAGVTATTYAPEQPVARDAMASFVARTLNLLLVAGEPVTRPGGSSGS